MGTMNSPDEQPSDDRATSGRAEPGRTGARSAWRPLRRWFGELTEDLAGDIEYGWPLLLAWATGCGVVLVALCRLILMSTGNAPTGIAVAAVAVVLAAAVVCLAGLAWASWRIRRDGTAVRTFGVAIAISLVAIGICTEAFAAITTMLWQHDLVAATTDVRPALSQTEKYYLWHLVDSVPVVNIPDGVQWRDPSLFATSGGGGLLLAYKVLLIGPLLRIGIGAFQMVNSHLLTREHKMEDLVRRKVMRQHGSSDDGQFASMPSPLNKALELFAAVVLLAIPVIIGLLMPLVFEPGAWLDAWVARRLDGSDFDFLRTLPQWLAAWLLVLAVMSLADELLAASVRSATDLALTVLGFLATIELLIVAAAAINLALLHVGVASTSTPMAPGEQVPTTLAGYSWHLAEVLPGLDIPGTLHWTVPQGVTDRWSTILILLSQLAMLGLLAVPLALAVQSFVHHAKPRPATPGVLGAAVDFAELFVAASSAADRAAGSSSSTEPRPFRLEVEAERAAKLVIAQLDGVAALFGPGEAAQFADTAAGALHHRTTLSFHVTRLEEHRLLREEEGHFFAAYRNAATEALKEANNRIRSATLDGSGREPSGPAGDIR